MTNWDIVVGDEKTEGQRGQDICSLPARWQVAVGYTSLAKTTGTVLPSVSSTSFHPCLFRSRLCHCPLFISLKAAQIFTNSPFSFKSLQYSLPARTLRNTINILWANWGQNKLASIGGHLEICTGKVNLEGFSGIPQVGKEEIGIPGRRNYVRQGKEGWTQRPQVWKGATLGSTGAKALWWKVAKDETQWRRALCTLLGSSERDRESLRAFKGVGGNDMLTFLFQQDTLVLLWVGHWGVSLEAEG